MPQLMDLQQAIFRLGQGRLLIFLGLIVMLFSLTLSLGFWQLDRADQKSAYLARNQGDEVVPTSGWQGATDGQIIQLKGHYFSQL